VLYIHGFVETMEVESIRVIAEAYLKRGDHSELIISLRCFSIQNEAFSTHLFLDIVILDWGDLADGNYLLDAVPNSAKVIFFIEKSKGLLSLTFAFFQLANILADTLLDLINHGLDVNKLHLVGHSLGEFYFWRLCRRRSLKREF
jgi:hypothetical protein